MVVGAAGGIGAACAGRLAEAGFGVVAVGRDKPGRAEAVVAELNATTRERGVVVLSRIPRMRRLQPQGCKRLRQWHCQGQGHH